MTTSKLLIVDDEPLVRALIRNAVDWENRGVEIVGEAGSAEEAIEAFDRVAPDIVCLDVCMPASSGIEVARALRERSDRVGIVVISGHDDFAYAQQFIRLGVDDYLLKPIDEESLAATIKKIRKRLDAADRFAEEPPDGASSAPRETGAESPTRAGNATMREIVDYIEENFADERLSLQFLADRYRLNPAYLSRAFKQETGENWVEYLTRLRLDRAMSLIQTTDMRNYEIAQAIGFADPKYFSACFKNREGITINEFRKGKENGK